MALLGLIIGNKKYENKDLLDLPKVADDVRMMNEMLGAHDYKVTLFEDVEDIGDVEDVKDVKTSTMSKMSKMLQDVEAVLDIEDLTDMWIEDVEDVKDVEDANEQRVRGKVIR